MTEVNAIEGISSACTLTKREVEVLKMIAYEYTSRQMADKLHISTRTVENHRTSLLGKLSAKNVAGLVLRAVRLGLVE